MNKKNKGDFGYLNYKKKLNFIIAAVALLIIIAVFTTGLIIFKSRNNYMTLGHPADDLRQLHLSGVIQGGQGDPREVSSPTMPLGARVRGLAFSSAEWGAWSVAMASMVPSRRPAMIPFTSCCVRRGGIDPGRGPLRQDLVLCEGKILGAGLAGNGHPVLLHPAHDVHRLCRRDMADVDPGAGLLRQHGRAHHLQLLSDGGPSLQPELAGYAALVHRPALHHGGVLTVAEDRRLPAAWPLSWRPASGWRCPRCSRHRRGPPPPPFSAPLRRWAPPQYLHKWELMPLANLLLLHLIVPHRLQKEYAAGIVGLLRKDIYKCPSQYLVCHLKRGHLFLSLLVLVF